MAESALRIRPRAEKVLHFSNLAKGDKFIFVPEAGAVQATLWIKGHGQHATSVYNGVSMNAVELTTKVIKIQM